MRPQLVTVAHGTRVATGNRIAASLTAQAAELLGVPAVVSYVELCAPLLEDVIADRGQRPTIVVPLLLSTGFHIKHDIPTMVAGSRSVVTPHLGPSSHLTQVMVERLLEAGATPGQPLVLAAAGSNDADGRADLVEAERRLSRAWGAPVVGATVAGKGRPLDEAIGLARQHGEPAVATYLLSPGLFSRKIATIAAEQGVDHVAGVLGDHPRIAALIAARYRAVLATRRLAA